VASDVLAARAMASSADELRSNCRSFLAEKV